MARTRESLTPDFHGFENSLTIENSDENLESATQLGGVIIKLYEAETEPNYCSTESPSLTLVDSDSKPNLEVEDNFHKDSTKAYMLKAGQFELLKKEEELELGRSVQAGLKAQRRLNEILNDKDECESEADLEQMKVLQAEISAGEQSERVFINHNLRLVISIAKYYKTNHLSLLDRIQEGNAGLITAVRKFDPEMGYKFSTYATYWIRQSVTRGIYNFENEVRVPVHLHENRILLESIEKDFLSVNAYNPSQEELSKLSGLSIERIKDIKQSRNVQPVSLNNPAYKSTLNKKEFSEIIGVEDQGQKEVEGNPHTDLLAFLIKKTRLNEREKFILSLRSGVRVSDIDFRFYNTDGQLMTYEDIVSLKAGEDKFTLEEIKQYLGISRERIRQIEAKALQKIRETAERFPDWREDFGF